MRGKIFMLDVGKNAIEIETYSNLVPILKLI